MAGIKSRIINGARVEIGSKAEQRYLSQGFTPETEGASSRRRNIASRGYDTTPRPQGVNTPSAINPQDLSGNIRPFNIPPQSPTSQAGSFVQSAQDSVDQRAKDYAKSVIDQNKTSDLKATDKTFIKKIAELLGGPGQTERTDAAYSRDVDPAKKELDDIQNQIRERSLAARRQVEEIEKNKSGALESGVNFEVNRVNKDNARELADLSIIEQAKLANYSTAKEIADRKVAIETEQQKNELDAYKFFYQENKADLTKAEDREFTLMINERERLLNNEQAELKSINDISLGALQSGAPTSLVQKALKAKTIDEAIGLLGPYMVSAGGAPTVKTINGVDMQWNPNTQTWDNIGSSADNAQKTIDQITFLRDAVTKANNLSNASGASGISRFVGDKFVGDTKFRQLEAYTNTLRTNVLTLMTDPGVKKFFGPQMSEADVRLMTAAGTTLNPSNNSPEQMRTELKRLDDLFNRMLTAVQSGGGSWGNTITAPDGRIIQIID